MVVLKEIENQKMFWGVTLDGGKRYTQTVERSFHISMAALEPPVSEVGVMVCVDKAEFLLCSLGYGNVLQQPLDLMFTEGEEVTFFLLGNGVVHLTGYLVEDQPEDMDMDMEGMYDDSDEAPELVGDSEDDSEDDEDSSALVKSKGTKRKLKDSGKLSKKVKLADLDSDEDDDEDDEDYEEDMSALDFLDEASEDEEDIDDMFEDDSEDDEEDSEEEEEEEVVKKKTSNKKADKSLDKKKAANNSPAQNKNTPNAKGKQQVGKGGEQTPGKGKQTPGKGQQTPGKGQQTPGKGQQTPGGGKTPQNAETPNTEGKKKKKKKKNKNKGDDSVNEASTPKPESTTPSKRVMAGGVVMEETKAGHGPEAKSGKMVSVYYVGKLANNGKQFDSCMQGKPFRFRLGKNEVIKGWDTGVQGMKVGGKRRLTIPAQQAYGNVKVGHIPANSTLMFDVELKAVS